MLACRSLGGVWRAQRAIIEPGGEAVSGRRAMRKARLLVIENDPETIELVSSKLSACNYEVVVYDKAAEALRDLDELKPDIILLRLYFPDVEGMPLCHQLSRECGAGIIALVEAEEEDIEGLVALELGADTCIAKPVDGRELLARVKALLRRVTAMNRDASDAIIDVAGIELDRQQHVVFVDGHPVKLSLIEYRMLSALMQEPGRVFSGDELRQIINRPSKSNRLNVGVYVARVRKKIEIDPHSPRRLVTVRGAGYKIVDTAGAQYYRA